MALKDWKKWDDTSYLISWVYKKSSKKTMKGYPTINFTDIFIIKYTGITYWTFVDRTFSTSKKSFKTKSQALVYAKSYMRNH